VKDRERERERKRESYEETMSITGGQLEPPSFVAMRVRVPAHSATGSG
jgi:hypothetical protein